MRKFFGTDGIRAKADLPPFDNKTLRRIGYAISKIAPTEKPVLLAMDTRESGARIVKSIAEGIIAGGKQIETAGVFPTPALSLVLNKNGNHSLGIMVSASHNPYTDNGIKVLSGDGTKLPDELENRIEEIIEGIRTVEDASILEKMNPSPDVELQYINHINAIFRNRIEKLPLTVVIDCANGATYKIAPRIIGDFVNKLIVINDKPDGRNINNLCGSTHIETLRNTVLSNKADFGIAFDGDGDRALFVDSEGNIIDGDHILALCAVYMQKKGELGEAGVVSTVMANIGLEEVLGKYGINFHRIESVGDRYVYQKMLEVGSLLGGEQSGHIIFLNHSVTGDGIITALKMIETIRGSGKSLAVIASIIKKYPQFLLNVPVKKKKPLESMPALQQKLKSTTEKLDGRGRINIRYSGTEDLLRIMVEGVDYVMIKTIAEELAIAAENDLK